MKIAIVGCGAVGSYYGACLWRAGHETHFLLRSDYDFVRREGVAIRSPRGDFVARPHCARVPGEIGVADLVVVALKTTANAELPRLLPAVVGSRTAVLTLQNGLGNEEALAALFSSEQILGGMCFVCLNRIQPGLIVHLAHGKIVLGEFRRKPQSRTQTISTLFREAGVPCDIAENLERAHWEKLIWNIPFNGLGVAGVAGYDALVVPAAAPMGLPETLGPVMPTDALLAEPRWAELVRELMVEIVNVANARRLQVDPALVEQQIERTRSMGAYRASTLIDFERGMPLELESLFLSPLEEARRTGTPVPRLTALCRVLQELDEIHRPR